MTEAEVAAMVGDMYWSGHQMGESLISDADAVAIVAEYAGVSRGRACALLLLTGPSARARRRALRRKDDGTWSP